ncbi:MAG: hypothetical protein ACOWWM_20080 [Desulfobacterales bacterium]
MVSTARIHAVLTGDVVDSSRLELDQRAYLATRFDTLSAPILKAFGEDILPLGMETIRGDGFQALLGRPEMALRISIFVRASLRADARSGHADVRIAVGIGTVEFIGSRVSEGLGPAYELSGKRLDQMKRGERLGIESELPGFDVENWDVIAALIDVLAASWTPKQAHAVELALQGMTQEAIARTWEVPIKQQTVGNHLKRAGWGAIRQALERFEYSVIKLLNHKTAE